MQVANPTCLERETILFESLLAKKEVVNTKQADDSIEAVIDAMKSTNLDSITMDVNCNCTRKCATVSCACKKAFKPCDSKCHVKNAKCQNK